MAKDYHEPEIELSEKVRDQVRAINSLKEEIEAVDWYSQRVAAATDEELKDIMWHNAKEEMEHAMMTLEWLRRNMEGWDEQMRTYLFTEKPILEVEKDAESEENNGRDSDSLGIEEL